MGKVLVGYTRVSRQGDRDELRSPELQQQAIERYAVAEGLKVEFAEPEIDVSGSKRSRPILGSIIARVKSGEVGGLVVAKLDRLSRMSPRDRVALFEEIEGAGGVILSAGESLDVSTPAGRFAREVFLGAARMQWETYRDGFEDAKQGAIGLGIPINSRAATGYVKGEDRRLVVDPEVGPIIREVFERRAQGEGPAALATFLEQHGVKTSQGSASWSKQAIYNLIRNRVYLGELRYGRDGRYVNADSHEPIVDLALWTAAQHPNGRRLAASNAQTWEFLLTGLIRCHACRYALQGTTTSRRKRIYRCTRKHAGGVCPAPARVDADTIEALAIEAFWSITEDIAASGTPEAADHSDLERVFDRAAAALKQYMAPEVQEAVGDMALWAEGLRERREARDAAAEALGRARAASPAQDVGDVETLRSAWERMDVAQRRDLLGLRFDCFALARDPLKLTAYPAGTGPADLPRRGFTLAPTLAPFPGAP